MRKGSFRKPSKSEVRFALLFGPIYFVIAAGTNYLREFGFEMEPLMESADARWLVYSNALTGAVMTIGMLLVSLAPRGNNGKQEGGGEERMTSRRADLTSRN